VLVLPVLCLLFSKSSFLANLQYEIIQIVDGINMFIGEWAKWLLVVMVVSIAFGVIALSIFGQSSTKYDESAMYFHALVILLGSAATLLAGKHVRVDVFHSQMNIKAKAFVDLVGFYGLLIPFCIVLIWNAQSFVGLAWVSLEGSAESDGIRGVFLLKTCVSLFAVMLLAQGMAIAGRAVLLLIHRKQPPLPDNVDPLFDSEHEEAKP
ncbi:MAG: TRAP transporter small permease subunit, partial [Robiginitomaculum sp.]|nr:TRAP transporter small permease subunit [Robiginitomaculum sp.]